MFRYKRIKMYITKSVDKRTIQFSLHFYYLPLIILQKWDHEYLRHLSTEYRSILGRQILSVDMSAESRPIYRPTLGRYVGRDSLDISTDINRHACRPTPGRYFTATRPPLGRHSAATYPILIRYKLHYICIRNGGSLSYILVLSTHEHRR